MDSTKKLEKLKKQWEDLPNYDEERFQLGYRMAQHLLDSWNEDENPPKVYLKGRRVHHGEIGIVLGIFGMFTQLSGDSFGLGYAYALIDDDIDDALEWFDFKKGGDPKKLISVA